MTKSKGIRATGSLMERFEKKYLVDPNSGCWLWTDAWDARGYGTLACTGKRYKAHRVSHILFKGAIPDGLEIDHLCRVKCCVNPNHLEAVTHLVNVQRGDAGKHWVGRGRHITHCPSGHEKTADNSYFGLDGKRQCRPCRAKRDSGRPRKGKKHAYPVEAHGD